jgi:hypothetical protein
MSGGFLRDIVSFHHNGHLADTLHEGIWVVWSESFLLFYILILNHGTMLTQRNCSEGIPFPNGGGVICEAKGKCMHCFTCFSAYLIFKGNCKRRDTSPNLKSRMCGPLGPLMAAGGK